MRNTNRNLVRVTALVVSVAYASILSISGLTLQPWPKQVAGFLPTVAGLLAIGFDLWLWNVPPFRWVVSRPYLRGTWAVELQPRADSLIPEGGNRSPISAALVINQSFWSTGITLLGEESVSESTCSVLQPIGDTLGRWMLSYIYTSEPKQARRHVSQPSRGATRLLVVGKRPRAISGAYWTDRLTAGDMNMTLRSRKTDFATYESVPATISV